MTKPLSLTDPLFIANTTHEMRTVLNSIIGFSTLLLKQDNLDERTRHYIERILNGGVTLLQFVNIILDVSKQEIVPLAPVNVHDLIKSILDLLEGEVLAFDHQVALEMEIPSGAKPLITDEKKLKQILTNLVDNAIKYTERGIVLVRVTVDPESQEILSISVSDTGCGIPADLLPRIFDPFVQGQTGQDSRKKSTGLGLAVVKSICDHLGYRITVTSEPGSGSTFTILIKEVL